MGNGLSAEEWRDMKRRNMERFASKIEEGPDVRVNRTLQMFTSLDSSDNLRRHYDERKTDAGGSATDWTKALIEKLADLSPDPGLAGLGALAVAILIDIESSSPPEESTKEALRGVFAEEKASEVWDQIDECLKRCTMNLDHNEELVTDMRRIEVQLSTAVTRLKNSMVRDGHLSSEALKAWVNGAAFHIQLLVHLVRLGGIQSCQPVERLVGVYLRDLDSVFNKHRQMVEAKCQQGAEENPDANEFNALPMFDFYLVTEESEWYPLYGSGLSYGQSVEAYYNGRYRSQQREIQQYFTDVGQKLQELVQQQGVFNVN